MYSPNILKHFFMHPDSLVNSSNEKGEDIGTRLEDRESVGWNFPLSTTREFQMYLFAGKNKPVEEKLDDTNRKVWLVK